MSDATSAAILGGTLGGICGLAAVSILVMRTTCPNLFARYFGWRTDTSSFVPTDNPMLTIKTPREQSLKVYRSNKEFTSSRRLT